MSKKKETWSVIKPSAHSAKFVVISSDGADKAIPIDSIGSTQRITERSTYIAVRGGRNFFVDQPLHDVRAILRTVRRDSRQLSFDFGAA